MHPKGRERMKLPEMNWKLKYLLALQIAKLEDVD